MASILVAEDDREVRELIDITLRLAGYDVVTASNGEQALALVKFSPPDLIMLDVRMPRLDGYETCKALKSDKLTASIPVLFLSARGNKQEVKTGLALGAVEYILKPISPDKLTEKIKRHLPLPVE